MRIEQNQGVVDGRGFLYCLECYGAGHGCGEYRSLYCSAHGAKGDGNTCDGCGCDVRKKAPRYVELDAASFASWERGGKMPLRGNPPDWKELP